MLIAPTNHTPSLRQRLVEYALLPTAGLALGLALCTAFSGCTAAIGDIPDDDSAGIGGLPGQGGNGGSVVCSYNSPDSSEKLIGSGVLVTQSIPVSGFQAVDGISCNFQVTIQRSDTFAVTVEIDDNVAPHFQPSVVDSTLELGLDAGTYEGITVKVTIAMPALIAVDGSGASATKITGFASSLPLEIDVSGASSLSGDIVAGSTLLSVDGASQVTLTGSATELELESDGAARIDLALFPVGHLFARMSGNSQAAARVDGILDADLSQLASLRYTGNTQFGTIRVSGSASLRGQ